MSVQSVVTSAGRITFARKGQTTRVSMRGRRTFKVTPCRKSPGWFTAYWDDAGEFDLSPLVLEESAVEAYTSALKEFWGIKVRRFDVESAVVHVLSMLNEFGVNVKRALVSFDPHHETARINVRQHVIHIQPRAIVIDYKRESSVVTKPTRDNVRNVLREYFAPASYTVKGKRIVFGDHAVVMRPGRGWSKNFIASYLKEMADSLTPGGSAAQHRRELSNMNNDGTWAVVAL